MIVCRCVDSILPASDEDEERATDDTQSSFVFWRDMAIFIQQQISMHAREYIVG